VPEQKEQKFILASRQNQRAGRVRSPDFSLKQRTPLNFVW
jgi:hypothetical protein